MPANNPQAYQQLAAQLAGGLLAPTQNWTPPAWVTPTFVSQGSGSQGAPDAPSVGPISGGVQNRPLNDIGVVPGQGPGADIDLGQMLSDAGGGLADQATDAVLGPLAGLLGGDDAQGVTDQQIQQAVQGILNSQQNAALAGTPLHVSLSGPMPGNAMFGGYEAPMWTGPQMNLHDPLTGLLDPQAAAAFVDEPATLNTNLSTIMGNPQMSPAGTRQSAMGSYRAPGGGFVQGILDPSTINQIDPVGPRNILPPQFRPGQGIMQ